MSNSHPLPPRYCISQNRWSETTKWRICFMKMHSAELDNKSLSKAKCIKRSHFSLGALGHLRRRPKCKTNSYVKKYEGSSCSCCKRAGRKIPKSRKQPLSLLSWQSPSYLNCLTLNSTPTKMRSCAGLLLVIL